MVIHGYLSGLPRPKQVAYLFRNVVGVPVVDQEVLRKRTAEYRGWVETYARNHKIPMEWAEKGVRKEDHVLPWLHRMERTGEYAVVDEIRLFGDAGRNCNQTFRNGVWWAGTGVSPLRALRRASDQSGKGICGGFVVDVVFGHAICRSVPYERFDAHRSVTP